MIWVRTSPGGIRTEELEDDERRALVNVSPLPDGTCVVSLSICIPGSSDFAKLVGEMLLAENREKAVSK